MRCSSSATSRPPSTTGSAAWPHDWASTRVVVVGAGAHPIHLGASDGAGGVQSVPVPDRAAALALLRAELRRGDTVLVKSSRDAGLRQLGEDLVDDVPGATS